MFVQDKEGKVSSTY